MIPVLLIPDLDHAERAAIATALDRLRPEDGTGQAYLTTRGHDLFVSAVRTAPEDWPSYSMAAARRAAAQGRSLLPVRGAGDLGGWLWTVYDTGAATPLSDHRKRLLPTATCLRLLSDVARALDDAATQGLFPCELPPESVFVSRRGAQLGDLGTAREAFGRASPGGDTTYVPPEVLRGEPAGDRSGVYIFGALLYHLFAGASPRGAHRLRLTSWRPDLPASMDLIVSAAMANDPERRPRSAGEAHELVKRAIRDAPAAPGSGTSPAPEPGWKARPSATLPQAVRSPRKVGARGRKSESPPTAKNFPWSEIARHLGEPAQKPAAAKSAPPNPAPPSPRPAAGKPAPPSPRPAAGKPAPPSRRPAAHKPAPPPLRSAAGKPAPPLPRPAPPLRGPASAVREPIPWPPRGRSATSRLGPFRRLPVVVVAGSALLGAVVGLLLGQSPAADPARAEVIEADGMGVAVPPGWRAAGVDGSGVLAVRQGDASESRLRVRLVHAPPVRPPGSQPVRLGALQAWRSAFPGVVRYAAPTTEGTVLITCRATPGPGVDALRECERTASTLTLDTGNAVPLARTLEAEDRLRGIVADLRAERDMARRQLARADEPNGQRVLAANLVRSYERAAGALGRLSGAEPIEAAVRRAAAAYASLAASAESGSTRRWEGSRERLRRLDDALDETLAARG